MASLCDTCRDPGACCRSFRLYDDAGMPRLFPPNEPDLIEQFLAYYELPFEPQAAERVVGISGEVGIQYRFSCSALTCEGRCSIYAKRPEICRRFEAGSSPLCVHHTDGN